MKRWLLLSIVPLTIAAAVLTGAIGRADDMLILDIQAGEPFGDAIDRSTLQADISIPLEMQGVPLPPLAPWNSDAPYQLRLQAGDGKDLIVPWTPAAGMIWMTAGVIDQIALEFRDFGKAADASVTTDIDAIVAFYSDFQALEPQATEIASCYHNRIPLEFLEKDRRDSKTGQCDRVRLAAQRQKPQQLRDLLQGHLTDVATEITNDPEAVGKTPLILNLGQWWLPNGNLVRVNVIPVTDPDDAATRLVLDLNIREFFRAGISRLAPTCYDQQALFPDKMAFSPRQAAQIFHGLYDDFYPPVVDGQTVTDMIALQQLDWSRLTDDYWSNAETRRGFCTLLRELEEKAGYDGPVAPLR